MKNLRLVFLSLLAVAAFVLTGGLARAGGPPAPINPVKTCGVGPTDDIVAIDQLWDAYAHNLDSGDAKGVADLFTKDGGYILLYNNLVTQTLVPMGYSPTTTGNGTSGTPGGGCTALGYNAIVAFLTNIGLGNDYPRAQLAHHIVTSKCIDVEGNHATMTAYWNELVGPTPPSTTTTVSDGGQYDNTYVKINGVWKADQNRVIFDTNNVDYPCLN